MPEGLTARDLMTKRFLRISTAHTLRETMGIILYGEQKKHDTGVIVVIDEEGDFAGCVTPENVVGALSQDWEPKGDESDEEAYLTHVQGNLGRKVSEVVNSSYPRVSYETNLATMVRLAGDDEYECLPLVEGGRVEGLVYVSDVFKAAAQVSLSPEDEGIQLDK